MRGNRARYAEDERLLSDGVERSAAGAASLPPPAAMLLRMQEGGGNAQVARMMQDGGGAGTWPAPLRSSLESAFGLPLGGVPLTFDSGLGKAAAADGVGVAVNPQWYDPASAGGQHLLAHEVAHLALGTRSERAA